MAKSDLQKRVDELIKVYGGVRYAGRVLQIDPSYLCRLRDGVQKNPTATTLEKLGLKRIESFKPL